MLPHEYGSLSNLHPRSSSAPSIGGSMNGASNVQGWNVGPSPQFTVGPSGFPATPHSPFMYQHPSSASPSPMPYPLHPQSPVNYPLRPPSLVHHRAPSRSSTPSTPPAASSPYQSPPRQAFSPQPRVPFIPPPPARTSSSYRGRPESNSGVEVVRSPATLMREVLERETRLRAPTHNKSPFTPPVDTVPVAHLKGCLEKLRAKYPEVYLHLLNDPDASRYFGGGGNSSGSRSVSGETAPSWVRHVANTSASIMAYNPGVIMPTFTPVIHYTIPSYAFQWAPVVPIFAPSLPPTAFLQIASVPYTTASGQQSTMKVYPATWGENGASASGYDPTTGALLIEGRCYMPTDFSWGQATLPMNSPQPVRPLFAPPHFG